MAFEIFNDSLQGSVFLVFVIFTPLCILATALRFVASHMATRGAGIEDWFALGALVFFLAWVITSSFAMSYFNGHAVTELSPDTIANGLRALWAAGFFFMPNQTCAKLSILFLYNRIFGINVVYGRWTKALGLAQVLLVIPSVLVNAFQCTPVSKYWNLLETTGSCLEPGPYLAGIETTNSLIDFSMAVLAIFMMRQLQTSLRNKLKLGFIFILGGFAGVIGFIKIGLAFNVNVHYQAEMGLWATVQMACSVICCCAIKFKPLFAQMGGAFSRLTSKMSSLGTNGDGGSTSKLFPSRGGILPKMSSMSGGPSSHGPEGAWINLDGMGSGRGEVSTSIGAGGDGDGLYRHVDHGHNMLAVSSQRGGQESKTVWVHRSVEEV